LGETAEFGVRRHFQRTHQLMSPWWGPAAPAFQ
jgi:hypothetical protein